VYYASPLLGPSLAPLIAGVLTQTLGWRANFWFLAIFAGINFLSFVFFLHDTFRHEVSRLVSPRNSKFATMMLFSAV
jgi:MFS family permease